MIKTLSALRVSFWENHPQFASDFRTKKRQKFFDTEEIREDLQEIN